MPEGFKRRNRFWGINSLILKVSHILERVCAVQYTHIGLGDWADQCLAVYELIFC